jgi:hypothetical protein
MNAWLPPGSHENTASGTHGDVILARQLGLERCDERRQALDRTVAMIRQVIPESTRGSTASRGGWYETTPCPSEIVPGVSAVQRPTMGMTGAWTAASLRTGGGGLRHAISITRGLAWRLAARCCCC